MCHQETRTHAHTHINQLIISFVRLLSLCLVLEPQMGKGSSTSRWVQRRHALWQLTHTAACSWLTLSVQGSRGETLAAVPTRVSFSFSDFSLSGTVYQQRTPAFPAGKKRHSSWEFEGNETSRWGSAPLWVQLMFAGLFSLLSVYIHLPFPNVC